MEIGRRARNTEDKQQRRQAILDVAWALFQETSYAAVTMNGVAERAGLAKGTMYLYFKTKEELFLTLQIAQLQSKSGQATLGTGGTQTTPNSSTASGCKGTSDGGSTTFRRPPEDIITLPDDPAEVVRIIEVASDARRVRAESGPPKL